MHAFAAIEWDKLLQVIWVSLVAGVSVTAVFSIVILAGARAADARRSGSSSAATAYAVVAAVATVVFVGGLVFGVSVILTK